MFAVLGWMFHASLASKMFLSLFFLFEMTREHQQLELEMFLQLLGTESLWSCGRFPEGVPEGAPMSSLSAPLHQQLEGFQLCSCQE